ncbi:dentin sialophosphoprotein precursor [Trypanosoma rangeli]|uniref:Dentin sialophosphoprotein n=1 Tax=Trypanosoma rangeli TaxID=5698 RepID=A0A422NHY6_TRYRA|nr:dentin sialophosphoprotein precursor [Trypanosoma rangeli]RNF05090.1 dentin sialophosphoprotein precursor [Trypanosoma rangeli]|eukprot:RNF05090.1 dentin sialophosphoprotein precursor [Trypanosoma rangeli]
MTSLSADMGDQRALLVANELGQALMFLHDDSLDRQSSASATRVDYQQMMESHTRRAAVMADYRLMVERRRSQCEQQPTERDGAAQADGSALSERQSVNEMSVTERHTPKAATLTPPDAAAAPLAFTTSTITTTTTATSVVGVPSGPSKGSCKWTRSWRALADNTASSAAKKRPKVNSTPNTLQGRGQASLQQRKTSGLTDKRLSPLTTPRHLSPATSQLSPRDTLQALHHTQLACRHEPTEGSVYVSTATSSFRSLREPVSDHVPNTMSPSLMHEENASYGVNDAYGGAKAGGETVATSQHGDSTHLFASPSVSSVSETPHCPDASTLEIETEEDKRLLQQQGVRVGVASARKTGGVFRKFVESRAAPSSQSQRRVPAVELVAVDDKEEPSFAISDSLHSITEMTPILKRFGRQAKENVSACRRTVEPFAESVVVQQQPTAPANPPDDVAEDSHVHVEDDCGRMTEPMRVVQTAVSNMPLRGATGILSERGSGLTVDDKAACIATVAAVLQGILVQTRRVLPCYYCGEAQPLSTYRLHLDFCKTRTEALYTRYGLNSMRFIMSLPVLPIPAFMASDEEKGAFARACYRSVKESIVPCPGCNMSFRIHDFPEHQDVCIGSHTNRHRGSLRSSVKK